DHFFPVGLSVPPRPTLFPYTTLFRSPPQVRLRTFRRPAAALVHCPGPRRRARSAPSRRALFGPRPHQHRENRRAARAVEGFLHRSEEHTSELQSHLNLVCRPLLGKKM